MPVAEVRVTAEPCVVLGPAQRDLAVETEAAARLGLAVTRRRSGGGAVLLRGPWHEVWVDVTVGREESQWCEDVGRAMWWVGEAWAAALGEGEVWRGPLRRTPGAEQVCWASVGPGEVVDRSGRKLVGISQRRTRERALFQACAYLVWDHSPLEEVLLLPAGTLAACGAAVPVPPDDLLDRLLARLTTPPV